MEAARTKEAKQREFEAKQREEAKTVPTTPKQDKRKKAVLTPRNAQIPPKKGKNIPQQNDFDVSSPVRKHKKPTPPKPAVDEEMQSEPEVENYEEEEEVTTYVELTVEEAEAEIRERMSRPRVLSFDNYVPPPPPPERLPSLMKTVKLEDTTDIVDETIQSPSAFKTPVPQKLFNSVLQESSLQERCDEPIPMEDFEDTKYVLLVIIFLFIYVFLVLKICRLHHSIRHLMILLRIKFLCLLRRLITTLMISLLMMKLMMNQDPEKLFLTGLKVSIFLIMVVFLILKI